jgi:hypothetical protein
MSPAPITEREIPTALRELLPHGEAWVTPDQGMTSDVVIVGPVVLKRCRDPRYLDWLRREVVVLHALQSTGLPIPRPLGDVDREDEVWLAMTLVRRSLRVLLISPIRIALPKRSRASRRLAVGCARRSPQRSCRKRVPPRCGKPRRWCPWPADVRFC